MDPFIGQLMCVGFDYAPVGWIACNGQILQIAPKTVDCFRGRVDRDVPLQAHAMPGANAAGRVVRLQTMLAQRAIHGATARPAAIQQRAARQRR